MDFFSGGEKSNPQSEYNGEYITVSKLEKGNQSKLVIQVKGYHVLRNPANKSPSGIPPSTPIPTGRTPDGLPPATPFNPNQFPSSGNLTPTPTGSGEFEASVPDIDNGPDPDFGMDSDLSIEPETDPTKDPDKPTDPETPPDTPPDEPEPD